jgi:hypothetical protein
MILVNLFKVKDITAMFCSLMHRKPESVTTVRDSIASSAPRSRREAYIEPEEIRIGLARVAQEARKPAPAGAGRQRPRAQAVLTTNAVQFGKPAT